MPKLQMFAACRQVIIDEESKSVSLIGLLDTIAIAPGQTEKIQKKDSGLPVQWAAFSLWRREDEDAPDLEYEQRFTLMSPSGESLLGVTAKFNFSRRNHRQTINVNGFPLAGLGDYRAVLALRRVGTDEWRDVAEYPITIELAQTPTP